MKKRFSDTALRVLIIPLVIEQILAISVGMVDTMMISFAGEAAISGVSLVDMINHLLITVFSAVATGGAVIVSQYIGHEEPDNARLASGQLVTVTGVLSILVAALCLIFRAPLLSALFGTIEPDVMTSALTYFRISAYSYPFIAVYNAGAALFRSMGNSRVSMVVSTGMNIFNAVGNAILMFGFGMGVAGAAYASLLARALAAVTILLLLQSRKNEVYLQAKTVFRADLAMIRRIIVIAAPNGIENGVFQLGRVLVVSIIATFGTVQIAANAVANNLDSMGCIIGQAMNLAMITVVGQCLGASDTDEAEYYAKKLMKITYIATALLNLTLFTLLPVILGFYDLSDDARRLAVLLIIIHNGCAMLLWPASFTLPNALRAGGDVRFPLVISMSSMLVFRIVFSIILGQHFGMGAVGVWIAMVMDWVFRVTCFVWRFKKGKWKTIKVIG